MEFTESDAIKAMRAAVPADKAGVYTDDELLGVIDIIWDYYEDHGLLDVDGEADVDMADLVRHVAKTLRADTGGVIDPADAEALVRAEVAYEDSLDED